MKRVIMAALIAVTLSPVAHAEFCDAPLTAGAEKSVKSTLHYQAYPAEIGKAMNSFCWLGMEAARMKQADSQVYARADIEARRWLTSTYGADNMPESERLTLQVGLSNAMIAGYTLTQQPQQIGGIYTKANKAAADKATADKKTAANKAAADKRRYVPELDDLLGDLSSGKNAPKSAPGYVDQLKNIITARARSVPGFGHQKCELLLTLDRAGNVVNVNPRTGNLQFCGAVMRTLKGLDFPPAPANIRNSFFDKPITLVF